MSTDIFKARGCFCDMFRAVSAPLDAKCGFCLAADNAALRQQLDDYQNREAACCPEGVGFDELIGKLRASRDQYKALASVGTWHEDCRPNRRKAADEIQKSQQRIDTLATDIQALTARAGVAEAALNTAPKCPLGSWTQEDSDRWFTDYAKWRVQAQIVVDFAVDPVPRAPHSMSTRDATSLSSSTSSYLRAQGEPT